MESFLTRLTYLLIALFRRTHCMLTGLKGRTPNKETREEMASQQDPHRLNLIERQILQRGETQEEEPKEAESRGSYGGYGSRLKVGGAR